MARGSAVLGLILIGCASSRPPSSKEESAKALGAGPSRSIRTDGCPKAFDLGVLETASCAEGDRCVYPGGSCECGLKCPCIGAERSEEQLASMCHPRFTCQIEDATMKRPDGCPA